MTERRELPSKIAALSSEGKRLVEAVSNVKGAGQRLLDAKLQEVGEQLGCMEARLRDVEHSLSLFDGCELEAEWVSAACRISTWSGTRSAPKIAAGWSAR